MVDEIRVARLLRSISERTAQLAEASSMSEGTRGPLWLDGVKYLFVTLIEGVVDVAHHIAAAEKMAAPDTNAAALRLLGSHGVVDQDLAGRLARAVGFRNVLVHQYTEVDDRIVMDALHRLDDFREFVAQVSRWIREQAGEGGR